MLLWSPLSLRSSPYQLILSTDSPHIPCRPSTTLPACLSLSLVPFVPCESALSPLALLFSSPSLMLLQAALLPLCLPRVLPLEDMHLGSYCTLLCVLINILAASRRKWVFLWANPLWGGWLEQRKTESDGRGRSGSTVLFSVPEIVKMFPYKSDASKLMWMLYMCGVHGRSWR